MPYKYNKKKTVDIWVFSDFDWFLNKFASALMSNLFSSTAYKLSIQGYKPLNSDGNWQNYDTLQSRGRENTKHEYLLFHYFEQIFNTFGLISHHIIFKRLITFQASAKRTKRTNSAEYWQSYDILCKPFCLLFKFLFF